MANMLVSLTDLALKTGCCIGPMITSGLMTVRSKLGDFSD